MNEAEELRADQEYRCPKCGETGAGFAVRLLFRRGSDCEVLSDTCIFCLAKLIKQHIPDLERLVEPEKGRA